MKKVLLSLFAIGLISVTALTVARAQDLTGEGSTFLPLLVAGDIIPATPSPTISITPSTSPTSPTSPTPTATSTLVPVAPTSTPSPTPTKVTCGTLKGLIAVDTILKRSCQYLVEGDVLVESPNSLTIEEGVTVLFTGQYYLSVPGTTEAKGTSSRPIVFAAATSSPNQCSWSGLKLGYAQLDHITVQDSCNGVSSHYTNVPINISNSTFIGNRSAMSIYYGSVSDSLFTRNFGIVISKSGYGPLQVTRNNIVGNTNASSDGFIIGLFSDVGSVSLTGNTIDGNTSGGEIVRMYGNADVQHNEFEGNLGGKATITLMGANGLPGGGLHANNIENNESTYDVYIWGPDSDISGNYWGTTDMAQIRDRICDYYCNLTYGKATIVPILDSPVSVP